MASKAQQGAWNKGAQAARNEKPRIAPYEEKTTSYHRGVTFSRSFINAWLAGYDSVAAKAKED